MNTLISQEKASIWVREPVAFINGILALLEVTIPTLVIFEILQWTPDQVAATMGVIIALGTVFKTLLARHVVTPVAAPQDNEGRKLSASK